MSIYLQLFIYMFILGGAFYTLYRLRTGYLPFEGMIEDVMIWYRKRKEAKK